MCAFVGRETRNKRFEELYIYSLIVRESGNFAPALSSKQILEIANILAQIRAGKFLFQFQNNVYYESSEGHLTLL